MIEYLGEIKNEFENTLACLSRAQIDSNHEKNGGRKSRDTLPLRIHLKHFLMILSLQLFNSIQVYHNKGSKQPLYPIYVTTIVITTLFSDVNNANNNLKTLSLHGCRSL